MNVQELIDTASMLVGGDKSLLAMDESNPTCNRRFAGLGIPQTEEARRAWRELIVTTPGLGESISGVILYDETIRQQKKGRTPFVEIIINADINPGIKVDTGAKDMAGHPGEKITEGLDGLRDRLKEHRQMGVRFAKWRAVIAVGTGHPQPELYRGRRANVGSLCRAVPGTRVVPAAVAGIAFLSGGQSAELASARWNAMNAKFKSRRRWALAFSFSRAIQQPALEIWRSEETQVLAAQHALQHRVMCNQAVRRGEYSASMEQETT